MEPVGLALTRIPSSFCVGIIILSVAVLIFLAAWKAGNSDDDELSDK